MFVGKNNQNKKFISSLLFQISQSMELPNISPTKSNVSVTQMMEVFTNSHQNTNSSDHIQTKSLPTFEKLLLCSLIICMRTSKKRLCTRAKVVSMKSKQR
jgi:hypothetical protein